MEKFFQENNFNTTIELDGLTMIKNKLLELKNLISTRKKNTHHKKSKINMETKQEINCKKHNQNNKQKEEKKYITIYNNVFKIILKHKLTYCN